MPNYQFIEVTRQGDVAVVYVVNPLIQDRLLVNELGDELIAYVEQQKPQRLIVSFERVTYCSSEVIGSLIRARRRVISSGGRIRLCAMKPEVRRLFKITHLDSTVFDIDDNLEQAVEALP